MSSFDSGSALTPVEDVLSTTDVIVEKIRRAVLQGELRPGEPLVERELAARLGVSKTPVREALKVLARSGLVMISPFRGAYVREVSPEFARSLYEVRLLLEPEAIRLSVAAGETTWVSDARALLRDARAAAEGSDLSVLGVLNRRFHRLIYGHSGNEVLTGFLDDLQDQVALIATVAWRRRRTWEHEAQEHNAILDAIAGGDADRAADLAYKHIAASLEGISAALADGE